MQNDEIRENVWGLLMLTFMAGVVVLFFALAVEAGNSRVVCVSPSGEYLIGRTIHDLKDAEGFSVARQSDFRCKEVRHAE